MSTFGLLGIAVMFGVFFFTQGLYYSRRNEALPLPITAVMAGPLVLVSITDLTVGFNTAFGTVTDPIFALLVEQFGGPARFTRTDILRVLIVVPTFVYASYTDIKDRIVRDEVWMPMFFFGTLLLGYDLFTGDPNVLLPWFIGNIAFATIIGAVLFGSNLFGGADFKALVGIALCIPTYPVLVVFPLHIPPVLDAPMNAVNMFSLIIISNTALVALFYPLVTVIRNVLDGFDASRLGLMLTARRVELSEANSQYGRVLPLWAYESDANVFTRFKILLKSVVNGIDTKFLQEYTEWHQNAFGTDSNSFDEITNVRVERFLESDTNHDADGDQKWSLKSDEEIEHVESVVGTLFEQQTVWMTPGIPFIVPMTVGLLLSLTIGDIVWMLLVALN